MDRSYQGNRIKNESDETNPESIIKMRLAKGEITPEAYSHLRKLISR